MTIAERLRELAAFLREDLSQIDGLLKEVQSDDVKQMRIYVYAILILLEQQEIKINYKKEIA